MKEVFACIGIIALTTFLLKIINSLFREKPKIENAWVVDKYGNKICSFDIYGNCMNNCKCEYQRFEDMYRKKKYTCKITSYEQSID